MPTMRTARTFLNRLRNISNSSNAPILNLPDELLLKIVDYFPGALRSRKLQLLSLSLTCNRLRIIALEALLTNPVCHLFKAADLVRMYHRYPTIAQKVRKLEITILGIPFGIQPDLSWDPREAPVALQDALMLGTDFKDFCINIIRSVDISAAGRSRWILDLHLDYRHAFLGILLAMLPSLQELYLGSNSPEGYVDVHMRYENPFYRSLEQKSRLHSSLPYLDAVIPSLVPKLTTLELPANWSCQWFTLLIPHIPSRVNSVLSNFMSLRVLAVPHYPLAEILLGIRMSSSTNYQKLPPNLEVLRIVDVESTFVERYLSSILLSGNEFRLLRRVEFYTTYNDASRSRSPANCYHERLVRKESREAGIEIFERYSIFNCFRASDAYGQPWHCPEAELVELEKKRKKYNKSRSVRRREKQEMRQRRILF